MKIYCLNLSWFDYMIEELLQNRRNYEHDYNNNKKNYFLFSQLINFMNDILFKYLRHKNVIFFFIDLIKFLFVK